MKMLAVTIGLCLVFVFVWERVDMVRLGYQVERLKHEKVVLERERDELKVKFSALSSPDRIAKVAAEKFGMSLPQPGQVVMVQSKVKDSPASAGELRIARNDVLNGRR